MENVIRYYVGECIYDNVENVIRYCGEYYKIIVIDIVENVIRYCGECYKNIVENVIRYCGE